MVRPATLANYVAVMFAIAGVHVHAAALALSEDRLPAVVVTGSAEPAIARQGARAVTVISAAEISRSGATSLVDLMGRMPAMQGAIGESASVGIAMFGFSGVSLRDLGESRTLVLLNGHRLASFGGQTLTGVTAAFDLNAIPLAVIERIEVLRDGASAVYGSDAIAGVVNILTRRGDPGGEASMGTTMPRGGAVERRVDVTRSHTDVWSVGDRLLVSLHHDERTALRAAAREQSRSGRRTFEHAGKRYQLSNLSSFSIPANVVDHRQYNGQDYALLVNPYLKTHGVCPPRSFRMAFQYDDGSGFADDYCAHDFASELEIYPERVRNHLFASYAHTVDHHDVSASLLLAESRQRSRVAPTPGSIEVPAGSTWHDLYLNPIGITGDSVALYRLGDLGQRTDHDQALFVDMALGLTGPMDGAWRYQLEATHSQSRASAEVSGYPGTLALRRLGQQGSLEPFALPSQQSATGQSALSAIGYRGRWDAGTSTLSSVSARVSTEWSGVKGRSLFSLGANWSTEQVSYRPSLFAQGLMADPVAGRPCDPSQAALPCDTRFGDPATAVPYRTHRAVVALFGELATPLQEALLLNTAIRRDTYTDFGSATTAQASLLWTPRADVVLRGSLGSGFRAPSGPQATGEGQPYGMTSATHGCSEALRAVATSLGTRCRPSDSQYAVIVTNNPGLQPERSTQVNLGMGIQAVPGWTVGADLWHVSIRDTFGQVPEAAAFEDPGAYSSLWRSVRDADTGQDYLAFATRTENMGKMLATGLDVDVAHHARFAWGSVDSRLAASYLLRKRTQLQPGGPYHSSVGAFSELGNVSFRWKGRWTTTFQTEAWSTTLSVNFKSGYTDQATWVDEVDDAGRVVGTSEVRVDIPWTATLDLQTQWQADKDWVLTFGVLNVLDADPPFSPSVGGTHRGHQSGYDDRYYDPRGRSVYAQVSTRF